MGRIAQAFAAKKSPLFIGFTVAGDPDPETSFRAARALIDGGTDILELGVPFSDPVADGPVIQAADERALAAGTDPDVIFSLVARIRSASEVPIVLLTYYNTVFRRGAGRFYQEAKEAGVDGILVADMPFEESDEVTAAAARTGIDPIFLIARTTSDERIQAISSRAGGYLYLVSVLGVTGARESVDPESIGLLRRVRGLTTLPVAPGFGIATPDHARTFAEAGADGVIVGSAIVRIVEQYKEKPDKMERELKSYVTRMKAALDQPAGELR